MADMMSRYFLDGKLKIAFIDTVFHDGLWFSTQNFKRLSN